MARAGRKRENGDRYPGGKLKQNSIPPARIRRMIDMASNGAADPALATYAGWLRLNGHITDAQMAAAVMFDRQWAQYRQTIGLPDTGPRSVDPNAIRGNTGGAELTQSGERAIRRFEKTREAILRRSGQEGLVAIQIVVTHNQACAWEAWPRLRKALEAVIEANS